jgi:hypothetical protein
MARAAPQHQGQVLQANRNATLEPTLRRPTGNLIHSAAIALISQAISARNDLIPL